MGKWGLAALVGGGLVLSALPARADDGPAPIGLSVAVERVAGVSYGSARLDAVNGGSFGATAFTLAGAAIDPIDLPRVSGDAILPSGLTLGGGLGYSHAELSIKPDSGTSSTLDGEVWLLSPRVGYRIRMSPLIDLWPRGGLTFARAGFTDGNNNSYSLFYTTISLDMAAALRLTESFNVLGGLAYDHVIAASGSETESSQAADLKAGGQLFGISLWFGLGGYVL